MVNLGPSKSRDDGGGKKWSLGGGGGGGGILPSASGGGGKGKGKGWEPLVGLERETERPEEAAATLRAARETPALLRLRTQVQFGSKTLKRCWAKLEGGQATLGSEPSFSLALASILYNPPLRKISIFVPTTSAKFLLKFHKKSSEWDTWLNGLFRHHLFAQATFLCPCPPVTPSPPPSPALLRGRLVKAKRLFLSITSKPHEPQSQSWASSLFASSAPLNPRLAEEEKLLQDLVELLRLVEETTASPVPPRPPPTPPPTALTGPTPAPTLPVAEAKAEHKASTTNLGLEPPPALAPSKDGAETRDDETSSCSSPSSSRSASSSSSGDDDVSSAAASFHTTPTSTPTTTGSTTPTTTPTTTGSTTPTTTPTTTGSTTPTPTTTGTTTPTTTPSSAPEQVSPGPGSGGVAWRAVLPAKGRGMPALSLGLLLRSVKEGSLPLEMFEPLSALQRLAEMMEAAHLLDALVQESEPVKRMALVTAFAMSTVAGSRQRIFKPFNPLLGETFALDLMEERGWRWMSEQVSHSPDVSAFQAEGVKGWSLSGILRGGKPKTSFSYVSVTPTGRTGLCLPSGERYEWNPLEFLLLSPASTDPAHRRLEHVGTLQVRSSRPNLSASLVFSRGTTKVSGLVLGGKAGEKAELVGLWNESLSLHLPSQPPLLLYKAPPLLPDAGLYFGMGRLSRQLNQHPNPVSLSQPLPCTDSRLRPDQRALEEGKMSKAGEVKRALEKAQRERKEKGSSAKPLWFTPSSPNDLLSFQYNHSYWQHSNQRFNNYNIPPIFTTSPSN